MFRCLVSVITKKRQKDENCSRIKLLSLTIRSYKDHVINISLCNTNLQLGQVPELCAP